MYNLPMSPATAEAVSELPYETLIAYLEKSGWRKADPFGKYAVRFLSPDRDTEKTVIVPINKDVADYGWLMINALIEAAKNAGQTPDQFFEEICRREEIVEFLKKFKESFKEKNKPLSGKSRALKNVSKTGGIFT
jgi:hypothetical protein